MPCSERRPYLMKEKKKVKESTVFQIVIGTILVFATILAVVPFILLISSSFTAEDALLSNGYGFWPTKFSLYAYEYLFVTNREKIFSAYGMTMLVTVIGTALSLVIGPLLAYAISRKDYPRRKIINFLVFFTMIFNGGTVSSYIIWTQIFGIRNSIAAYIFPTLLMNGFYIMLMKNNFSSNIHPALIEAAKIDGAGEFYIYLKIILPLSLPILATVGLMVAIAYWNDWVNGLYYITDSKKYSLQVFMNSIINNIKSLASMSSSMDMGGVKELPSSGIRMAMAVIGILPIFALYPFFQKAFVAGIALGGVKE